MGATAPLRSAIVSIGNELLFGQTVDTNSAWLGRVFAEWGIPVARRLTVGDDDAEIRRALDSVLDDVDLVATTGGLGPTRDDLTKPVVADHLGLRLVEDARARAWLEARFRSAGYDRVPTSSEGQAEIPEGATPLRNSEGSAPGLLLEHRGKLVVLLPGVPRELRAIVSNPLRDALVERLGVALESGRVHHRTVHTTGIGESSLAERLEARLDEIGADTRAGIALAYLPDLRGVDLRFTIQGGPALDAARRFDALVAALAPVLDPYRFEAEDGDVVEAVSAALRESGRTLAVAESCTGGLVGKRMTDLPGSSEVFVGGVVAYSDASKVEVVGVPRELLERDGAVSESVACALAVGAARRFGADAGIGVTGVAGPGGGSGEKPVGTVWIATTVDGEVRARLARLPGDRESVRERAAQRALADLLARLREGPAGG